MTGWPELVTTALLGTDRREILDDLPDDLAAFAARLPDVDPAGRLLDIAAGCTAYTRAGAVPQTCPPPSQAPPEDAPLAPREAQRLLLGLVTMRAPSLVGEWLRLCADRGCSVAPEAWAGLADLATSHPGEVDPELLRRVLGRRGTWFLSHNDRWLRLVETDSQRVAGATPPVDRDASTPADRDTLRSELDRAWGRARSDDKVTLLHALAPALAPDDEPRLLRAVRDRSADVREEAARLLSRLPESGYVRRMTDRATSAITVTRSLGRRGLVVTAPTLDEAMSEDGISDKPPRTFHGGPGAFVLRQILAGTPLMVWTSTTGLQPSEILEVAARTSADWLADVRAGWAAAAHRQSDVQWAEALLAAGEVDEGLVGLVPAEARVRLAVRWTQQGVDPGRTAELVLACPRPWPAELAEAALRLYSSGALGASSRRFADAAGHAMGVECYPVLEEHVLGWVPRKGMSPHEAAQIRSGHARLEEVLATRIAIHRGFTGSPTTVRRFDVPHLR